MAKILIKNGRLFDGESFFQADILTNGALIEKIEKNIVDDANFVFDAAGKNVSAGFVDLHMHMRGISCEAYGAPIETGTFPFGVTAAADAGADLENRAMLEALLLKTVVFTHVKIKDNQVNFAPAEHIIRVYGDRVVGLKVYFDTTGGEVKDEKPLEEICAYARQKGLRVMVHCSSSPVKMSTILSILSPGDILTHAYHGYPNDCSEDDFCALKAAAERGVVIDTGFAGFVHTDFGVMRKAIAAGALPSTISTDLTKLSIFSRGGRYGMGVCMSIARHLGMKEEDIYKAVTVTPARALGKGSEWGTLRVGGAADITVSEYADEGFDMTDKAGNRITSAKGYRTLLTIVDGQLVYKH